MSTLYCVNLLILIGWVSEIKSNQWRATFLRHPNSVLRKHRVWVAKAVFMATLLIHNWFATLGLYSGLGPRNMIGLGKWLLIQYCTASLMSVTSSDGHVLSIYVPGLSVCCYSVIGPHCSKLLFVCGTPLQLWATLSNTLRTVELSYMHINFTVEHDVMRNLSKAALHIHHIIQ